MCQAEGSANALQGKHTLICMNKQTGSRWLQPSPDGQIDAWDGYTAPPPPSKLGMIIIVCFYHYARGARVNPPPLGFMLNVCDSVHELKLFLGTPLWDFDTFEPPPTLPTFWLFCFQTSPQWWWTRRLKSAEFFFHSGSTLWHLKKENKTVISFHTFQNNALMRGFAHFKNVGESGKPKVARGRISGETYTCYISKHNYLPFPGWQCCSAF